MVTYRPFDLQADAEIFARLYSLAIHHKPGYQPQHGRYFMFCKLT